MEWKSRGMKGAPDFQPEEPQEWSCHFEENGMKRERMRSWVLAVQKLKGLIRLYGRQNTVYLWEQ